VTILAGIAWFFVGSILAVLLGIWIAVLAVACQAAIEYVLYRWFP
jgi:hypothetical protein